LLFPSCLGCPLLVLVDSFPTHVHDRTGRKGQGRWHLHLEKGETDMARTTFVPRVCGQHAEIHAQLPHLTKSFVRDRSTVKKSMGMLLPRLIVRADPAVKMGNTYDDPKQTRTMSSSMMSKNIGVLWSMSEQSIFPVPSAFPNPLGHPEIERSPFCGAYLPLRPSPQSTLANRDEEERQGKISELTLGDSEKRKMKWFA
jgi:hypothetical protein